VGIRAYASSLNPLREPAALVNLVASLATLGIFVTILMLINEYARRWRRQRRGP